VHEKFWDSIAPRYDNTIFNTLTADRNGNVERLIRKYATGVPLACDFGCGVGRFLPLLLDCCGTVFATDFSAASLKIAEHSVAAVDAEQERVRFQKSDLTRQHQSFCKADMGLLINVLIMPRSDHRAAILTNARRNLRPGAPLVVAVPSLECVLYTLTRLIEWRVRDGDSYRSAENHVRRIAGREIKSLPGGIVEIEGTKTKHHLREEFLVTLRSSGFRLLEESRIEYDWNEDFVHVPRWLKDPYPWDWLFVAQRV